MRDELWRDDEVATLRYGLAHGCTYEEIAEAIDRTPGAVSSKAWKLGLCHKGSRWWRPEETDALKRMLAHGATFEQAAEALGRQQNSVIYHAQRLGIAKAPRTGKGKRHEWTREDDVRLLRMRLRGMRMREIGEALGVSRGAAQHRYDRLRRIALARKEGECAASAAGTCTATGSPGPIRPTALIAARGWWPMNGNGTHVPRVPKSEKPRKRPSWSWSELQMVWRHPDMTAEELAEMLPGRTPQAIRHVRMRQGRYRTEGVVPLCQRCGEHPVNVQDPEARRWGMCKECAQAEKDYRDRNDERLRRENNARRQRRHNGRSR